MSVEIGIAIAMLFIIIALIVVSVREGMDDYKIEAPKKRETEEKKEEASEKKLCSWIPKEGTVEWAHYVLENYSTEYFKPVDITRAYRILDAEERNKTART